ncbi:sporulation protein YpjB [Alkalicoccobacillus murimartini]|uniref:Sporulation protein YpjB n=1 Tax=Alkalicoccobacillus murimartini TaxID=171685 RepID=A0ABT9YDL6_9BACI|nr:sporulation protein YpjB [Alkalicoccobacillus murimartini]MDQ0205938.1 sporulation protein YpjB [Alkalicoccobacillus murimartini]
MRFLMVVIVSVLCLFWPHEVIGQKDHSGSDVNQTADLVLQLTKQGDFAEANQLLESITYTWEEQSTNMQPFFTTEAEQSVLLTLHQAKLALQSSDMEESERIDRVTSFRLTLDAVTNDSQPLWLFSETSLLKAADELGEAALLETPEGFYYQLNEINRQYQVIRPAVTIQATSDLYLLDQQLDVFLSSKEQVDSNVRAAYAVQLKEDIETMYEDYNKDEADPSLFWIMFTIGGMILFSLSYVGWRKYRASQVKEREKENS